MQEKSNERDDMKELEKLREENNRLRRIIETNKVSREKLLLALDKIIEKLEGADLNIDNFKIM